ncbi:hypothetical protein [Actinotalea sp. Marseille-Q4924]|uniref:hypothetical protein n=1 Tax=Actinotalea sp. Marseille-Q4924 TaxID=2866571 RepID=UPI001CE43BF5|nr:hypothetical protein [Actinotalea sp. Marseille-Q4924]
MPAHGHRLTLDGVQRYHSDPLFDRPRPPPRILPAPLARGVAERRADVAARRRLSTIWDDPAHATEKADLLARLSRPTWPRYRPHAERTD